MADGLESRLVAQRIQEIVDLQCDQARIVQAQTFLEPFERLGSVAPLRVDLGVLVCAPVAVPGLQGLEYRGGVGMSPEFLVCNGQTDMNAEKISEGSATGRVRSQDVRAA